MNTKVLQKLEYNKVIDSLVSYASSLPGKKMCEALLPMTDLSEITIAQTQTADALTRLFKKGRLSFSGNTDILFFLRSMEIGAILSQSELLKIASLLECANRVKNYNKKEHSEESSVDSIDEYFNCLEPLTHLSAEIRRCIISEEEISDDASPTLKGIRRNMAVTNDKIRSQLSSMVNNTYRTYLQDAVITTRDNRYCIPVKAEYRNQVTGMIHDQSSSGSTLFIEPTAIVNLNNTLKELSINEAKEIEVILSELSVKASEYVQELKLNMEMLTMLDFIFAKASLAMEQKASMPIFNNEHYINIRKGRHPLLNKDTVIPIDIHLGKEFDLLIVTGPNTGGKTVSLKTVGLLNLMGQAGLHIPALDRSSLTIFTEIYADIGDEQSIEQSLSTFSSHMTNIVTILEKADQDSLCLFDELGAGTDPTEGAALAIAILTYLHDRGIRTMATTHYSELKVFALTSHAVENACCEFDVETLRPTYRLLIGIPGKSNAFAISQKLGLASDIIELAKTQINEDDKSFEDLLTDLEASRKALENERLEITSYKNRIKELESQLKSKREKIDDSKERILRSANEEARDILAEAKATADRIIRDLQKSGYTGSLKELESLRTELRNQVNDKNEKLSIKPATNPEKKHKKVSLHLGDTVKVLSMGVIGSIVSLPDAKGQVTVQCGILRSQVVADDCELVAEEKTSSKAKRTYTGAGLSKAQTISPEINLLGKTVDEALAALEKYLDDAYLSHLSSVRVVHGKGTGALRSAVQNFLRKCSYVKSYRIGEYGEGDAGVTIVDFK